METEKRSPAAWLVAMVVVAAIIGMLVFARGPEDQNRSGAMLPSSTAVALLA